MPAVTAPPIVRFAPSPTGRLHVGNARAALFNWLFARRNGGTMILRLDDTDVERNTDASVSSIFDGLKWLGLSWDEQYQQSERGALHRALAETIFQKGLAYRDFTPAHTGDSEKSGTQGTWLFNPGMRDMPRQESDRRAGAGEPFALRFRVPRDAGQVVGFVLQDREVDDAVAEIDARHVLVIDRADAREPERLRVERGGSLGIGHRQRDVTQFCHDLLQRRREFPL